MSSSKDGWRFYFCDTGEDGFMQLDGLRAAFTQIASRLLFFTSFRQFTISDRHFVQILTAKVVN